MDEFRSRTNSESPRHATPTMLLGRGVPPSPGGCPAAACDRTRRRLTGDVSVTACGACGRVEWFRDGVPLPPFEGVAEAFGAFDLVGTLPAINAPGAEVLLYAAPDAAGVARLESLPPRCWLHVAPGLAMSHDRRHLLVAAASEVSSRLTPA